MKKNISFEEIWEKIKSSDRVIISLHVKPDGDSIGGCCAMKYVLEKNLNKKVDLISPDLIGGTLKNLDYTKDIIFHKDLQDVSFKEGDIAICIDSGGKQMFSNKKNFELPKNVFLINIDHHQTNSFFGNLNYVDPEKASACDILVEMFKKVGIKFDRELGRRLLLGICTDGGFFTFDTNPEDAMRNAVFLFDNGVNYIEDILKPVKYRMPLNYMRAVAMTVNKLKINVEQKFAYSILSYKDIKSIGLTKEEIRGPINELQYIEEFDFIFSLTELEDQIKGSFRSKKGVDVSLFAKELGGGGHKPAAAFVLKKMPLEEAEKKVLEVIKKIGIHKRK